MGSGVALYGSSANGRGVGTGRLGPRGGSSEARKGVQGACDKHRQQPPWFLGVLRRRSARRCGRAFLWLIAGSTCCLAWPMWDAQMLLWSLWEAGSGFGGSAERHGVFPCCQPQGSSGRPCSPPGLWQPRARRQVSVSTSSSTPPRSPQWQTASPTSRAKCSTTWCPGGQSLRFGRLWVAVDPGFAVGQHRARSRLPSPLVGIGR